MMYVIVSEYLALGCMFTSYAKIIVHLPQLGMHAHKNNTMVSICVNFNLSHDKYLNMKRPF